MTTDEKLDLILQKVTTLESDMQEVKADIVEMKDELVKTNKRLYILEGDTHQVNIKIDEIRSWARLDLKDSPFLKNRALA